MSDVDVCLRPEQLFLVFPRLAGDGSFALNPVNPHPFRLAWNMRGTTFGLLLARWRWVRSLSDATWDRCAEEGYGRYSDPSFGVTIPWYWAWLLYPNARSCWRNEYLARTFRLTSRVAHNYHTALKNATAERHLK